MTNQAMEMRRAYKRAWNRANRDKVKAAQERYWEKKALLNSDNDQDREENRTNG